MASAALRPTSAAASAAARPRPPASVPLDGAFWDGGAETFVHKGTNGRWRESLSAEDSAANERRAIAELGPEAAAWLLTGRR
jgi:aryl sulfotransferase